LAVEVIGTLFVWAAMPLAWIWVGARVYDATGAFAAAGVSALLGLLASATLAMAALARIDTVWVALRRRAGHDQPGGVLNQVVVATATLGLLVFAVWYYLLSNAFIIPFMPSR